MEQLRLAGDVRSATADLNDLPEPLVPEPGQEAPSTVLGRLRRDDR